MSPQRKKDKTIKRKASSREKKSNLSNSLKFNDEDFIVFGFTKDGVFDILKQTKAEDTKKPDSGTGSEFQETGESRTLSTEFHHSSSSSASFSFPVLEWELTGSPTLMPTSQDRYRDATKHKLPCIPFHCCKF
ncbi:hypothetical protein M5689_017034 [Euphorbia peplus]|nr:hypothetical protein M5689_017034 [Euphorbia peplus]